MKKIIAAFDGLKFSTGAMDYAIYLTKHFNAHLVGIFLDDVTYTSYGYAQLIKDAGEHQTMRVLDKADKEKRDTALHVFTTNCEEAGLNFTIHRDKNIAITELLHESIYADLLIVDSHETFTHVKEPLPSPFIRDLLTDVECPVLLVPRKFEIQEKIIFLYDGDPSSVYAVKMFSYLMAPFKYLPVEVLSIRPPEQSLHLPDNGLMKEFLKRHFPKAEYTVLNGNAEEKIVSYLLSQKQKAIVALGAYRRGKISRWFKPSMADVLMKNVQMPLFVAHNK